MLFRFEELLLAFCTDFTCILLFLFCLFLVFVFGKIFSIKEPLPLLHDLFVGLSHVILAGINPDCEHFAAIFLIVGTIPVGATSSPLSIHHVMIILGRDEVGAESASPVVLFLGVAVATGAVVVPMTSLEVDVTFNRTSFHLRICKFILNFIKKKEYYI